MSLRDREPQLREAVDKHARKRVGLSVAVAQSDETLFMNRGRISRDSDSPATETTIFEIGSITKTFTATLLADMALEGLVSLEDPVARWLPEGVTMPRRGGDIRLADLASHTSGLPGLPKGLWRLALKNRQNPYATFAVDDAWAAGARTRPRRKPGKRMVYSNYGAGLLGNLLCMRAGMGYEELVQKRICSPLAMVDTTIAIPDEKRARFATGHDRRRRTVSHWDIPGLAGAGALRSTTSDLLKYLRLQLDPGDSRLGRAAELTHRERHHRRRGSIGLGWFRWRLRGYPHVVFFHNGGTGGFRSIAGFVKETETAIVVLSNSSRWVDRLGRELLRVIGG